MRKLSILVCFLLCALSAACGGGGESSDNNPDPAPPPTLGANPNPTPDSRCTFDFRSVSNGASARLANSFWSCRESDGGVSGNYKLVFFDDGAGALSSLGAFTWRETACARAEATTTEGVIKIQDITGSNSIEAITFQSTYENGTTTDHACRLQTLPGVADTEEEVTPPTSIPSTTAPSGSGSNGDVLSNPSYAGTLYSVFAASGQFLGVINDNPFDPDSLCNPFGNFGNRFSSTSIWNQFGNYGSNFGSYSAFNNLTSTPPVIFANTQALAYLSTNSILAPRLDSTYLLNLLVASGCNISR